jgi:methylenetetrahydrofolate reductase (NADPH)
VSVTFGAGGSTTQGSRDLVAKLTNEKGLEMVAYVACFGLGPEDLKAVLDGYREIGVENILAVRGDPPRDCGDFVPHPESFRHASDFLPFIQNRYDFCLGAAGYPEGHIESESREKDIEFLKLKVERGAEFIIANYFYDNQYFFDFMDRCRSAGIDMPILPGVMPVFSLKMMESLAQLCGATITPAMREQLASLPEDDRDALVEFGIDYATEQCRGLITAGAPGVHIYTMDRSRSAVEIVNRLRSEALL